MFSGNFVCIFLPVIGLVAFFHTVPDSIPEKKVPFHEIKQVGQAPADLFKDFQQNKKHFGFAFQTLDLETIKKSCIQMMEVSYMEKEVKSIQITYKILFQFSKLTKNYQKSSKIAPN